MCPDDWVSTLGGGLCFYALRKQFKYAEAEVECESLAAGGRLAEIRDVTSRDAIEQAIDANPDGDSIRSLFPNILIYNFL